MKSAIFSILPFVGLAFAQESACDADLEETITETLVETVYETPTPALVADATTNPGSCGPRNTVSVTTTEKVYVTVSLSSGVPVTPDAVQTTDVTSTSTLDLYTTVTVLPSSGYFGNSSSIALFKPSASTATPLSSAPATHTPISPPRPSSVVYSAAAPSSAVASSSAAPSVSAAAISKLQSKAAAAATTNHGSATWYGGNISGGTCSFVGYKLPAGVYGTAISDFNWNNAGTCGVCVSVKGPKGNSIKAMVVDQCPGCGPNHLDLFPDAFAAIDSPNAGNITVDWSVVPCGISSPIVLKNKSGTSKFWFSMQVVNSNIGVAKLEVSTDGGATWKPTTRQPYNFFQNASGFGTDTVDVKVTSTSGSAITVKNVSIKSESTATAGSNFS